MANFSNLNIGNKKAIVAGHFCLDILPDLSNVPPGKFYDLFQPGHLLEAGNMNIATGGAASNTGINMSKLGVPTSIIARLGLDGFGRIAIQHMEKYVTQEFNHLNLIAGETTSYTIIINPPGIDRIFLHHPGANDAFTDEDVEFTDYQDHVLFHFGYPQLMKSMFADQGKRLIALFKKAKAAGFTTSLDTTFPDPSSAMGKVDWENVLKSVLPYVDIFCPSFEEAFFMLDQTGYQSYIASASQTGFEEILLKLTEKILTFGAGIAFLKLGDNGALIQVSDQLNKDNFGRAWYPALNQWKNQVLWVPSFQVEVVGTTGAGDATIAGFLSAILSEMSIEEAITFAMGVGACNVEAIDSVSGVRTWRETIDRINAGWKKNSMNLDKDLWLWSEMHQLWKKAEDNSC